MTTKAEIVTLLERTDAIGDRAIERALMLLAARQTTDEQSAKTTKYQNGRGFRPCHAYMGTDMGRLVARGFRLTPRQIAYWRKRDRAGNMRIGIYAGQLLEEAQKKAMASA